MQNSDFWTLIASLYVSQTSPAVLCLQCSVISTRTTCLYGFQPFSVVFAFKTAPFGAELQVCMGPRPHLSFCPCKSAWLAPEILVSMSPRHNLSFSACKTAWLAPSLYGSQPSSVVFACKTATFSLEYKSLWVPDLNCRFVHAKQRDLHKNKMTIWVPALTCGFVHAKQRL